MLDVLNSYHPRMQFTMEMQENGQLNFLDMTLVKDGSQIHTKWYHKPIASNRMLNFYSAHPERMKTNIARSLMQRTFRLTSQRYHKQLRDEVSAILAKNNYPVKLISRLTHEHSNADRTVLGNATLNPATTPSSLNRRRQAYVFHHSHMFQESVMM